jgi:itaconyl-CoA hydratase
MVSTIKLIATKLNFFINQGRRSNQLSEPNCEGRTAMDNLLPAYKAIGDHRYRETSGLYYEDFEPGDVFEHRPGRTILEVDNTWFTLLTLNVQQLHFDAAYAAKTEWKKPLVDSTFTLALLTGMSVRTVSAKVVANLAWDKVKATHPVFAGDTLYAESTVLHKRESKSRPTQGIVTVSTRGINQDGKEVMSFERTMLIYRRGHSPEEAANY